MESLVGGHVSIDVALGLVEQRVEDEGIPAPAALLAVRPFLLNVTVTPGRWSK